MTATDTVNDVNAEVQTALRLMAEYTPKLRQWIEEVRSISFPLVTLARDPDDRPRLEDLSDRFERIRPACHDLSRMASGLIEQSRADFPQRTELRLRLAEFENAMVTLGKQLALEPSSRGSK